jgi:hypothetical protein
MASAKVANGLFPVAGQSSTTSVKTSRIGLDWMKVFLTLCPLRFCPVPSRPDHGAFALFGFFLLDLRRLDISQWPEGPPGNDLEPRSPKLPDVDTLIGTITFRTSKANARALEYRVKLARIHVFQHRAVGWFAVWQWIRPLI